MKMKKYLMAMLFATSLTGTAYAVDIQFTFEEDAADFPLIGRAFTPGVVCGILYGLPENGESVQPTSFKFLSDVSGVGITSNHISSATSIFGGFNMANGVITNTDFVSNFDDPTNGGMQIRFNRDNMNLLHWNGGSGPVVGMGNQNGFSGASYGGDQCELLASEPVPVNNIWALFITTILLALMGLSTLRRQARRQAASSTRQ
jgi:hypothetical protein